MDTNQNEPDFVFSIKLKIFRPGGKDVAFGVGIAQLLRGVESTGTLSASAKSMGMAYSKAWRILRATEQNLGFQLIKRRGAIGSMLTPQGKMLLDTYTAMNESATKAATGPFEAFLQALEN